MAAGVGGGVTPVANADGAPAPVKSTKLAAVRRALGVCANANKRSSNVSERFISILLAAFSEQPAQCTEVSVRAVCHSAKSMSTRRYVVMWSLAIDSGVIA